MTSVRTVLVDGARLLTDSGTAQVLSVDDSGVGLRYSWGDASTISWADLGTLRSIEDGIAEALSEPLQPVWDGLDEAIRSAALTRLEIVQEIITGYRDGHPAFAREGEPRSPFGPGFGVSEHKRCIAMAKQLNLEAKFDRDLQRRLAEGDLKSGGVSEQTIRRWVREFKRDGLLHWTCQRLLRGAAVHLAGGLLPSAAWPHHSVTHTGTHHSVTHARSHHPAAHHSAHHRRHPFDDESGDFAGVFANGVGQFWVAGGFDHHHAAGCERDLTLIIGSAAEQGGQA